MEDLSADVFYELNEYLHPKEFANLRIALPYLNNIFTTSYIIRHILQKSNQEYQDSCFLKLLHASEKKEHCFNLVKLMIDWNYRNHSLIEKSIHQLIQKPRTGARVIWLIQNTDVRFDFQDNIVLCWAVKKNDNNFVRRLLNLFHFDLSLGHFKVLDWAVRFFKPSYYCEQEIINLLLNVF